MRLYLMRHGKADQGNDDNVRPLSLGGRSDIETMAKYVASQDIKIDQIYHSTLLRARQTAEIMALALTPPLGLKAIEGIEPWGNVNDFVSQAATFRENKLVCGHNPFMGEVGLKLQGDHDDAQWINFKTATVAAFELNDDGSGWHLLWTMDSKSLRGKRF